MFNRLLAGLFMSALILVSGVSHSAEDPQSIFERGKTTLESGLADEAITVFSELLKTNPQAAVYYHRGLAYSAAGKDALAIQDFDRAASMEPEQAAYHLRKGCLFRGSESTKMPPKAFPVCWNWTREMSRRSLTGQKHTSAQGKAHSL